MDLERSILNVIFRGMLRLIIQTNSFERWGTVASLFVVIFALTPVPVGFSQVQMDNLLFEEDFENVEAQIWHLEPGWTVIQEGDNHVLAGEGHFWARPQTESWEDFRVQFRLELLGGQVHLVYRDSRIGRYFIGFSQEGSNLNKQYYPEEFYGGLAGSDIPHNLGAWHTVEIIGEGAVIRFIVDGIQEWEYADPEPLSYGTFAFETLDNSQAYVDDILVFGPAPPEVESSPLGDLAWQRTGGPLGGLGYDVRMRPDDPEMLYVTDAFAGVFISRDGGAGWFPSNQGITTRVGSSGDGIPVFCLTIDPHNNDIIWVGTQNVRGIFKSTDGGASWVKMDDGVIENEGITFRGITIDPRSSDVVYAAAELSSWVWAGEGKPGREFDMTGGVVYKTEDGGQNWFEIWRGDNLARYIWIHPENHDLLYVSTGIFDREAANSNPDTLDPGGVGILRSHDGGDSWEILGPENGFRGDELYFGSLFMHPQNPDILIAAAGNDPYQTALGHAIGAIYLTEDGGDHWKRVLALSNASTVEISSSDPNVMYAGSINGIYRSTDGGHTWVETAGHLWGSDDVLAGFPIDMQCDPRDPMRIFVNNYIGGNFVSEDGGYTWRVSSKGYTGALLRQVDVAAGDATRVYSASRMGVFVSGDSGDTWSGTAYHPARSPEAIVVSVDHFDADHVLAVLQDAGPEPKATWDGGKSWSVVDIGLWGPGKWESGSFTEIVFSPYDQDLVLASAGAIDCYKQPGGCVSAVGHGVLRSSDGGATWSQTGLTGIQVNDLVTASENVAYAAASPDTIYRSEDGGQTWQVVAEGLASRIQLEPSPDRDVRITPILISIAVDPSDPNRLFAGFADGGLMISADGGQSWEISAAGLLPETSVVAVETDPAHPGVVYLGSPNSGVFCSTDSGRGWTALNDGLSTRAITDLALSSDGSVLYAATEGGGVWRLGIPREQ